MGKKICSSCNIEKELNEYHFIRQENRYNKRCKICINKYNIIHYNQVKLRPLINLKYKVCRTCKIEKQISDFNKERKQKDGYNNECKVCYLIFQKQNRIKNNPKPLLKLNHKICTSCKIELSSDNFYPMKLGKFGLNPSCKECNKIKRNKWMVEGGGREYNNTWKRDRRKNNINEKIKELLRGRFNDALKRHTSGGMVNKKHSALRILGCSIKQCEKYLSSQFIPLFNWSNHGIIWE